MTRRVGEKTYATPRIARISACFTPARSDVRLACVVQTTCVRHTKPRLARTRVRVRRTSHDVCLTYVCPGRTSSLSQGTTYVRRTPHNARKSTPHVRRTSDPNSWFRTYGVRRTYFACQVYVAVHRTSEERLPTAHFWRTLRPACVMHTRHDVRQTYVSQTAYVCCASTYGARQTYVILWRMSLVRLMAYSRLNFRRTSSGRRTSYVRQFVPRVTPVVLKCASSVFTRSDALAQANPFG